MTRIWRLCRALPQGWRARALAWWIAPLAVAAEGPEKIRVGYDATLQPIAYVDEAGRPVGFAADYVRAVARAANLEVEFVTGTKDFLQTAFREGRIDVIASLIFTEERAKVMDFSLPYLTMTGAVFAQRGGPPVRTPEDFRGRKVAVSRGNFTHDYMLSHAEWGAQLVPVGSTEEALRLVQIGGCDAAVNVDLVARKLIRDRSLDRVERVPLELPGLSYKYCMAVRKGEAVLLRRLDEAQLAVHESSDYRDIHERWIGPLHHRDALWRELRPYVMPVALALAGIVALLALQSYNVRRLSLQAAALRASEARLNLVLASGRHCLWDWDLVTNRVERGPLLAQTLGYSPEEIAPTSEALAQLVHAEDRDAGRAQLENVVAAPGTDTFASECRIRTRNGDWRWFATVGRVLERGPDGRGRRVVGTHTDITERKSAEEALRQLNAELEQRVVHRTGELAQRVAEVERLNAELESFSYSVSHDLRAPLRNITGFLELLVRRVAGRLDAESERFMATVTGEVARMGRLIDGMLAIAHTGQSELALQRVALGELVAEIREELRTSRDPGEVNWKVAPLPDVRGDRTLLRQVVANLLDNALKFTRHRTRAEITVTATVAGGNVIVCVRDNGAGFNPKYADKLFGVFQRLHNQRDFEGTGIGLANVKRIVERHGGRVWAEGVIDQGAAFYFSLEGAS